MHTNFSIITAFLGGIVSFASPCILPIIPGFLAYLAGASVTDTGSRRREIFINSLFFVIGFSIVFALLGALLNSVLASVAASVQVWLSRIGGVIIIFFSLYLMELIHVPFLERDYKFRVTGDFSSRYLTSFLFGLAFAAGWTPCVGVVLGPLLALAATSPGVAFYLLLAYALGLGVPFLLVGLFAGQASALIERYANVARYLRIAFGVILLLLGILVFTQSLNLVASFDLLNTIILK